MKRGMTGLPVVRSDAEVLHGPFDERHYVRMRDDHALRRSRRTRGEKEMRWLAGVVSRLDAGSRVPVDIARIEEGLKVARQYMLRLEPADADSVPECVGLKKLIQEVDNLP